ncbi:phage late control D family protein, partial [Acinetobacter indicus]
RPFTMQSNESDYSFISRLLREEGVNFLIDESQYIQQRSNSEIKTQILRLIDDNSEFKALERRSIKYHRSDATEREDTINSFVGVRSLQSTATFVHRWQQNLLDVEQGPGSIVSNHNLSSNQQNASLGLEQAFTISPAWTRDLKSQDQATNSGNAQVERLNKQLSDIQSLKSKYFKVSGTVRDTQVGYWFVLNEHPELDRNHSG